MSWYGTHLCADLQDLSLLDEAVEGSLECLEVGSIESLVHRKVS